MKKLFFLILALAVSAHAESVPWKDGETVSYDIDWGLIPVAQADFTAHRSGTNWALHLDLRTRGPIDALKPIRDKVDSLVAAVPWRSLRYEENRDESGHLRHRITDVDYPAHHFVFHDVPKKTAEPFPFPGDTLDDAQSLFYHLRQIDWSTGPAKRTLPVYYGKKLHRIEVTRGAPEKIDNPLDDAAPQIACRVLHLRLADPDAKDQWATVWLGDDAQRLPWRAAFKASFGTFTVTRI